MPYEDIKNIILEVNEDLLTEALIQVTCHIFLLKFIFAGIPTLLCSRMEL